MGNDQLIDALICENCGNPQLLSDDNLLGHGWTMQKPMQGSIPDDSLRVRGGYQSGGLEMLRSEELL